MTTSTLDLGKAPIAENCIRALQLLHSSIHKQAGMPRKALVAALRLPSECPVLLTAQEFRRHQTLRAVGCKSFRRNSRFQQENICCSQRSMDLNKPLHLQLLYEILVISNGCIQDLWAAVLLDCPKKQGCCSGNMGAIFAAFQGGLCRKLPAGREQLFRSVQGSYMLTRCRVGAGVVGVEREGQAGAAGQVGSWHMWDALQGGVREGARWGEGLAGTGGAEVQAGRQGKRSRRGLGTGEMLAGLRLRLRLRLAGWLFI